jgi:hypothetical protein
MDKIQVVGIIICGGGLAMGLLYLLVVAAAVAADRKWKREANNIVAHSLLDGCEPRWSGRTKKDYGVRKAGRHGL